MNLFDLSAKITLDTKGYEAGVKDATGSGKKLASTIGSGLATAAKVGTAAITAAAGGIAALTGAAVKGFADYEQLVGGVETLFGTGGQSVEEYAARVGKSVNEVKDKYESLVMTQETVIRRAGNAYETAGLSANQYMETVTGFSAALIQSLEGDTVKAADVADVAIRDMSDNANKMGTSMESIQYAYQGFAKQNYTINLMSAA